MPGTTTAPKRGRKKIDEAALAAANEASQKLGKAQQAAKAKPNGKADTGPGKQTQAGKAPPFAKGGAAGKAGDKAPAKKAAGKPAAKKGAAKGGAGKQQQSAGAGSIGRQGSNSVGTEMRGGTKQVLISETRIAGRGGRPRGEEEYPFSKLKPAKKNGDGSIVGPSFFIPDSDKAKGKLAVARKRERADGLPSLYWSRKVREAVNGEGPEVPGLRIWLGTPALASEV